ncbi:hypothetical protein EMPS_04795 [Entomortierella parvispora]|uniref:Uncharacterized protein n=1 Tax=Entomortierella parvispora TaxID=205924 RepID=A0A9P3H9V3_9FUNG|nr:hypothetical protein EMPS_04795 [Entomortierella parvispora]
MDVVRITQALRQQNPGRHAHSSSTRGGSALTSSSCSPAESSPAALRRETWDGASLTVNTSVSANSPSTLSAGQGASSPSSSSPPSSASPSSTFSLASYLPAAVLEASSGFFGTSDHGSFSSRMNLASVAGSTNLGEAEVQSLLLRSMPMFGNLISKE